MVSRCVCCTYPIIIHFFLYQPLHIDVSIFLSFLHAIVRLYLFKTCLSLPVTREDGKVSVPGRQPLAFLVLWFSVRVLGEQLRAQAW